MKRIVLTVLLALAPIAVPTAAQAWTPPPGVVRSAPPAPAPSTFSLAGLAAIGVTPSYPAPAPAPTSYSAYLANLAAQGITRS